MGKPAVVSVGRSHHPVGHRAEQGENPAVKRGSRCVIVESKVLDEQIGGKPCRRIEQEIILIDKDLLSETLEDRDRPAARRDRRLEVLVDDRQVGELKTAAAHVEQVRSVLEAGNGIAEEAAFRAPASGSGVDEQILCVVQIEPEFVASGFHLVIGRAAEQPIRSAAAFRDEPTAPACRSSLPASPCRLLSKLLNEVSLPNRTSSPSPPEATPPLSLVASVSVVVALLAEQIVEAARAAVEDVVAGAAMDLVVAAERKDLVVAARGEDPVVVLGAGDHVVAVRAGDDEIGVVEIVDREVVDPPELDREIVGIERPSSFVSAIRKVLPPAGCSRAG